MTLLETMQLMSWNDYLANPGGTANTFFLTKWVRQANAFDKTFHDLANLLCDTSAKISILDVDLLVWYDAESAECGQECIGI